MVALVSAVTELALVTAVVEMALVAAVFQLADLVSAMAEMVPDVLQDDR